MKGSAIMDFTPQVETREISDADLDNVSGGIVGDIVSTATSIDGVAPVASEVTSLVGTAEGATGVNTAGITGVATGL
jgi:hypothetical protein